MSPASLVPQHTDRTLDAMEAARDRWADEGGRFDAAPSPIASLERVASAS